MLIRTLQIDWQDCLIWKHRLSVKTWAGCWTNM